MRGNEPKDPVEIMLQELAIESRKDPQIMKKARSDAERFLHRIREDRILAHSPVAAFEVFAWHGCVARCAKLRCVFLRCAWISTTKLDQYPFPYYIASGALGPELGAGESPILLGGDSRVAGDR